MPCSAFTFALAFVVAVACAPIARAYDVQLDAETVFRAYEVRAPSTATSWSRRRFIQDLELRVTQNLAEVRDDRLTPRMHAVVQLRLNQEVGDTCFTARAGCFDATDSRTESTYLALATDGLLDAMLAYVDVTDLPAGFEVRAGRQLWIDPVGFARVDGVSARVAPTDWFALSGVAGLQVRATSVAGSSGFEPPGVIRLDLASRQQLLSTYASAPSATTLIAAAAEIGDETIVRGKVGVRDVTDKDGLVMRRVALSLRSSPLPTLHVSSLAVFDVADFALTVGNLNARWQLDQVALLATFDALKPRFDLGSIWAYFPTATVQQAELGTDITLSEITQVGGGLRARHTQMREASDQDIGARAFVTTKVRQVQLNADGYVWLGDLGDLWGVDLRALRPITSHVQAELGVSLQRVNDPARLDYDGVSLSEWARAMWQITDQSQVTVELTHAYNRIVAHRFSALATLQIGAWR